MLALGLVLALAVKIFLMARFPLLADEAYYVYWGMHPAGGYYDLPPMIGWWEAWLSRMPMVGLHPLWLRLPNLLVTVLVSLGIADFLTGAGVERPRARLLGAIYFFLPMSFLGVLVSPDVPLVFFSFFAAILFYYADRAERSATASSRRVFLAYFLAGALWGAAFLSKYFAVMMIPAIVLWVLWQQAGAKRLRTLGLLVLGAAPFIFQHVWWNAQNCWANFVFNLVTRQAAYDGPVYQTFGFYWVYLLILSTPFFWRDVFKFRSSVQSPLALFCFLNWFIPVMLFGLTALMGKGQGLHWYVSYVPFFVMSVGLKLNELELSRRLKGLVACSGVLAMLAVLGLLYPNFVLDTVLKGRFKLDVQMALRGEELATAVLSPAADLVVTDSYNFASVLEHQLTRFGTNPVATKVGLWGGGSRFGRVFDWTVDYQSLDRGTILLFSAGILPVEQFDSYFARVQRMSGSVGGAPYFLTLGEGFKAEQYFLQVLKPAREQFYPEWKFPAACKLKQGFVR